MGLFNKSVKRTFTAERSEDDKDVPGWLKMLQDNSWELEILISGGAIFSLFQLSDLVTEFFRTISNNSNFSGQTFLYIFTMLATKSLTLGFFIHILLRSFWVSLVALSSMFTGGVSAKLNKQAKPFKSANQVNLPEYIIKLDQLSAWMIYATFNMVFIIAGWLILFFTLSRLEYLQAGIISDFMEPIAVGAFIAYLLDFFLFSALRKTPYLSYILYPVFKIFDYISLRFIFQKRNRLHFHNMFPDGKLPYSTFVCNFALQYLPMYLSKRDWVGQIYLIAENIETH